MRKKVAIYIDYTLRIPSFKNSYEAFKAEIFTGKDFDVTAEDDLIEDDVRFFWREELKDDKIESFYLQKNINDIVDEDTKDFESYFYNEKHYKKFLEEYSFNLYLDSIQPNKSDNDIINVAQANLFDIILVDEYQSIRKIGNTLFYLSKIGIYPKGLIFLKNDEKLNEDEYFSIWNPKINKDHINKRGNNQFLEYFKGLEIKLKEEE